MQLSPLLPCIEDEKEVKAAEGGAILSLHSYCPVGQVGGGGGVYRGAADSVCACGVVSGGHQYMWRENIGVGGRQKSRVGDDERIGNGRVAPMHTLNLRLLHSVRSAHAHGCMREGLLKRK